MDTGAPTAVHARSLGAEGLVRRASSLWGGEREA